MISDDEMSDEDQNKSVLIVDNKKKKNLRCRHEKCESPTEFAERKAVMCATCKSVFHPKCVINQHYDEWLKFMSDKQNSLHWKFFCEFCVKEVKMLMRIKDLLAEFSNDTRANFAQLKSNTSKMQAKMEVIDVNVDKICNLTKKIDDLPTQHKKIENQIIELTLNSALNNKKIDEHQTIAKVIEEKIDDLKFTTTSLEHDETWQTVDSKKKKKPPSFSVMLKTNANKEMSELKKKMYENFIPNEASKIISGKDKLIAMFKNEEEQKNFADAAKTEFGEICNVTMPDRPNRRIKIQYIMVWTDFNDLKKEDIEKHMKDQNAFLNKENCKVVTFFKPKHNGKAIDDKIHVVMEVDQDTYDVAMKQGSIKYLYQEPRVVDGFAISMCGTCLTLDHPTKKCPRDKNNKVCGKCGGNHLAKDCIADKATCVNCVRANEEIKTGNKLDINHSVYDHNCPCYIKKKKFLSSKFA
jgi:hypothetical protein